MTDQRWQHHPPRLAVTGGIGSGKSSALAFLRGLGAATLSTDDLVHTLLSEPAIAAAVERRFGPEVMIGGEVNRGALARVVFGDHEALLWLESLLHPHVRRMVTEWAAAQQRLVTQPSLLVVEVPLLFETGTMVDMFDCVLLVTAPEEVRRRRLAAKMTHSEFTRRASRQLSEDEKAERSHFAYENRGSRAQLKQFIAETYAAILACAAAESESLDGP